MSLRPVHPLREPGDRSELQPAARITLIAFCAQAAHALLFIPLLQAYLLGHFHYSAAVPGYVLTAFGAAKLITQAPAGRLVDRIGSRATGIIGLATLLLCGLLFALVQAPLLFVAVSCLYGLGAAFLWPALFAVAANRYGESLRGRVAAAIQFAEAGGVAAGVGAGALLVDRIGFGSGFWLHFGLISVGLLAVLTVRRSDSRQASAVAPKETPAPANVRQLLRTPLSSELLVLTMIGALLTLAPNLLIPIVRDYANRNLGLQLQDLIVPLIPVAVIGGIAMLGAGAAADRFGRLPVTLSGLCLGAAGLWLLGNASSLMFAIPVAAVGAAGYLITQPAYSAAVFDASTPEHRGLQFGLIMVAQGLAEAVAPALGGSVAQGWGPGATFHLSGAVLALTALLTLGQIALQRRRRREKLGRPASDP